MEAVKEDHPYCFMEVVRRLPPDTDPIAAAGKLLAATQKVTTVATPQLHILSAASEKEGGVGEELHKVGYWFDLIG